MVGYGRGGKTVRYERLLIMRRGIGDQILVRPARTTIKEPGSNSGLASLV